MWGRRRSRGLLIALALASGLAACARQEVTLESLIARHVEARGGMERLRSIQTLRASGRALAGPGREALIKREVRTPGRVRTEFSFQGVTSVYACDGSMCWSVEPLFERFEAEPMSEADTSLALEQADLLGPLVDWEAKGHSIELLGKETIDGRETYKLRVTLRGGGVQIDYLDVDSALLVRRDSRRTLGGEAIDLETIFSDYRPVGGVLFPHSIKSRSPDRPNTLEILVEQAELNPPLDDARFEMPG